MIPSLRSLTLLALAGAGSLLFTGCYDDGPYYGRAAYYDGPAYDDRPSYYADTGYYDEGPDVDFYYVSGRPYSRSYGPLVFRDGGYYYSHGGAYIAYRGRTRARGDYGRGRTVVSNDYRGTNYNTTSARYRTGSTYRSGSYPTTATYGGPARGTYPGGTTTYRGTTRGSYPGGTYPSGTYGRATVRGTAPAATGTQVRTRPRGRGDEKPTY